MSERGTHVVGELAATIARTDPRSREEIVICYM